MADCKVFGKLARLVLCVLVVCALVTMFIQLQQSIDHGGDSVLVGASPLDGSCDPPTGMTGEYGSDILYAGSEIQGEPIKWLVPDHVVYAWCGEGKRMFLYENYLSVKSVVRALKPSRVYFLYDVMPTVDDRAYNTWLTILQEEYPFIKMEKVATVQICAGSAEARTKLILNVLHERGGIYVHENTIVAPHAATLHTRGELFAVDSSSGHGLIMARKGVVVQQRPPDVHCLDGRNMSQQSTTYCVNMAWRLHPKDIWESRGQFSELARWAAYGTRAPILPRKDYSNLAPNIVHYVWPANGKTHMMYIFYIGVLSALHLARVDKVFIHGVEPSGKYWDRLKNDARIKVIPRGHQTSVYQHDIPGMQHIADLHRLDIMQKYGGLVLDIDSFIVKPLSTELRAYEAVINREWSGDHYRRGYRGEFPDMLVIAATLGKPGAQYWAEFIKTMRIHKTSPSDYFVWNCCVKPYKIKELFPASVFQAERFSVNCDNGKCRPLWWPDQSKGVHHGNSASLPNWRNDTFTYHFTSPDLPAELEQEGKSKTIKSLFSDMVETILTTAGPPHSHA